MLLDEQGLGKTITTIAALDAVVTDGLSASVESVLVLAPAVVVHNWAREFSRWSPSRTVQVVKTGGDALSPYVSVVIVSHTLFRSPRILAQLLDAQWDLLVVDEAHNFRNREAKRTRALYGCRPVGRNVPETELFVAADPGGDRLVDACDRVWLLTGTPIPNHVGELWTHLRALWPESIPNEVGDPMSYAAFQRRFCKVRPTRYGAKVIGNRNTDQLRAILKPISLRRLKHHELKNLPAMRFETVALQPTRVPWEFDALADEIRALIAAEDDPTAAEGFAALKSSADFARFRRWCGMAKVDQTVELLRAEMEFGALDKVVVFAHHTDVVRGVQEGLVEAGLPALSITGGTSPKERDAIVQQFQGDADVRAVVCNIVAGGVGVTLTAASEAVFVELSPVPGENAQAADRIHRIGQEAHCRVRTLALAGSVDEDLVEILTLKTRMIREVLA